jgi:hypothetical protein
MTQGRYRSMILTSVRECASREAMMRTVEKLETLASIEARSTFAGRAAPSVRDVGGYSKTAVHGEAGQGRFLSVYVPG